MKIRQIVLTFILMLGYCGTYAKKNNCTALINKFSNVSQSFLNCAIHRAEPVEYCRKCGDNQFSMVNIEYNNLLSNEECKAKYFNQDRINIIEVVYTSAKSLWESGSCSSCYDWVDGSVHQNESEATTKFFYELSNFSNCIKKFVDKQEICSKCVDSYNVVNDIYKNIHKETNDKFCFDIRDAMNKTRLNWSHNLNCCEDRKTSLTVFIVTSVIISVLIPFVFYISFMFFGWRRDQLQEPLIDSDIQPSASGQMTETNQPSSSVPDIPELLDLE